MLIWGMENKSASTRGQEAKETNIRSWVRIPEKRHLKKYFF